MSQKKNKNIHPKPFFLFSLIPFNSQGNQSAKSSVALSNGLGRRYRMDRDDFSDPSLKSMVIGIRP